MHDSAVRPLTRMQANEKAVIVALAGGRDFQNRLVSMGLNVGCEIEVLRIAGNAGGPTLIATMETRLAIGHGMASKIMVAVDNLNSGMLTESERGMT